MKFNASSAFAAVLVGAGIVAGQSLSSSCQTALANIVASPDAQCLNPSALVNLFMSQGSSVVSPVNTWLTGLCSQASCSNSTIAAVVNNVTTGCSSDLASVGLQTGSAAAIVPAAQLGYPTVRQAACLQDSSDSKTMCATELLTNMQDVVGTLTIAKIVSLVTQGISGSSSVTVPQNVTCSNCAKEAYNIINQNMPSIASAANSTLSSQCGATFLDGSSPSGIIETASTASPATSSSSAARSAVSLGSTGGVIALALSSLVAVSSAFVLLA